MIKWGLMMYSQATYYPFLGKLEVLVSILMPLPQEELAGFNIQSFASFVSSLSFENLLKSSGKIQVFGTIRYSSPNSLIIFDTCLYMLSLRPSWKVPGK